MSTRRELSERTLKTEQKHVKRNLDLRRIKSQEDMKLSKDKGQWRV